MVGRRFLISTVKGLTCGFIAGFQERGAMLPVGIIFHLDRKPRPSSVAIFGRR
jgi:hypothetical protein